MSLKPLLSMDPIPGYDKIIDLSLPWAGRLHAEEGQLYGDGEPYVVHLVDVDNTLVEFGFCDATNPIHQCLRLGGRDHDLLEDIKKHRWMDTTIRALHGRDVLFLVQAVTQEPGATRAERVAATLPKTRAAGPWAVVLKCADRIANWRKSRLGTRHWKRYFGEYPAFREALYVPGEPSEAMWGALDALYAEGLAWACQEGNRAPQSAPAPALGPEAAPEPSPEASPAARVAQAIPQTAWILDA